MRKIVSLLLLSWFFLSVPGSIIAATPTYGVVSPTVSPVASVTPEATPTVPPEAVEPAQPRTDITQKSEEVIGPLEKALFEQELGKPWLNPLKYAIHRSVSAGVPPNTIVLLLLLPVVAAVIAGARHVVGLRGFGIFLPAALSIVFLSTGPVVGIGLFMVIVLISTFSRVAMKKLHIKLQYLPRMALILWIVVVGVLGVLFLAPSLNVADLTNISIFSVLILVLLAEDFTKVQIGKSARTAVSLAIETIILALVSFAFLTSEGFRQFALLNPELVLLVVLGFNLLLGKYTGLRVMEYWRYRQLILNNKK